MEKLELKKAIFYPTKIVLLRKKGDVTINIEDIDRMEYVKPTFFNYLFAGLCPGGIYPGNLRIIFNKKIGRLKSCFVKIKYKEFDKLPEIYLKKIQITSS